MFVTIPTDGGSISDRYTRGVRLDTLNILGFAFQFAVLGIVPICAVRPERSLALAAKLLWFCFAVVSHAGLSELEVGTRKKQSPLGRSPACFQEADAWLVCVCRLRWRAACS